MTERRTFLDELRELDSATQAQQLRPGAVHRIARRLDAELLQAELPSRRRTWIPMLTFAAGAAMVLAVFTLGEPEVAFLARSLAVATAVHLAMSLLEMLGQHPSRQASVAAHMITHGRYRALFWGGAIAPGVLVVVLAALSWDGGLLPAALLAGLVAQAALLAYESVFVRAGQDAPLS